MIIAKFKEVIEGKFGEVEEVHISFKDQRAVVKGRIVVKNDKGAVDILSNFAFIYQNSVSRMRMEESTDDFTRFLAAVVGKEDLENAIMTKLINDGCIDADIVLSEG